MKLSYNWLKEYISLDVTPQDLSLILTGIGLEVEGMEEVETVQGGLRGVVIGEVRSCAPHPNADKLTLTRVDVGQGKLLPIVCGAPNVAVGQKVAVATPGTTLYTRKGTLEIKATKIRGEVSEGMICAEDELGLGTDHSGIMVLDPGAVTGTPARDYFGIQSDTIYEIGLTPSRIDSGSHYGTARDLFAYFSIRKPAKLTLPDTGGFKTEDHSLRIPVEILNPEACPRYTGVTIRGVKVTESPAWLKNRLLSIGQSPINNVVDVTNFVLHELGQPLHAFDADLIEGGKVVVRTLPEGSPFTTLDGIERKLSSGDLMICNARKGMCIGGVFGGIDSGVTENTKNLFLESAYFDPVHIRRTARRHGLNTDASFRFERGADPSMTLTALKRAALLIKELGGGTISSEIVDIHPRIIEDPVVELSLSQLKRLTGIEIEQATVEKLLQGLGMAILHREKQIYRLKVPAYRVDVTREADVIEEIIRMVGYDQLVYNHEMQSSLSFAPKPDKEKLLNTVSDMLVSQGFYEIMQNSLTPRAYYENLESLPAERCVILQNPLSNDLNAMRQSLLFGGLEAIRYNFNRQQSDARFFEFGNVYRLRDPSASPGKLDNYLEEERFALWLTGDHSPQHWNSPRIPTDFFHLKSYAEGVLKRLGIEPSTLRSEMFRSEIFLEGLSYSAGKQLLMEVGEIQPDILKSFDIRSKVYYADLRWTVLLTLIRDQQIRFRELPRFPEVRRDLALLVDKGISYARIQELAYATEKKLLRKVSLFDVYEGEQVEKGKKSYAVSFILQDEEKTLTDTRIDAVMDRLIKVYRDELGALIR